MRGFAMVGSSEWTDEECGGAGDGTVRGPAAGRRVAVGLAAALAAGLVGAFALRRAASPAPSAPAVRPVGLEELAAPNPTDAAASAENDTDDVVEEVLAATVGTDNCNFTRRCAAPGAACYEQQRGGYAQCRASCTPGRDPTHWDAEPWTCRALGERAPGGEACSAEGEDCRRSRCCSQPGHTCYQKNDGWATCQAACRPGPHFSDVNGDPWSCEPLGLVAPAAAAWVAGTCAGGFGENCLSAGCCKNPGEQCYKKDAWYGQCRASCTEGDWLCEAVGARTPPLPPVADAAGDMAPMPTWAFGQCSAVGQGCKQSGCCLGMDVQCYEKDAYYAQCRSSCAPGPHADDGNGNWTCKELGPRSYGVSTKGFPSLYCFAVMRTYGYEVGLTRAQAERGVGIFACDDHSLLTADGEITIAGTRSIRFNGAPVGRSVDNTAGNTELFVHAWDAVVSAGVWRSHTFTLKADLDAVLLPDRVRTHLRPHVGQKMFVINCPWGDMVFGALEVFSYHALLEWATRGHDCPAPKNWGEDKYMTHCMDFLGVTRVHDIPILADNLCLGSDCSNPVAAAFHPYKDVGAWFQCWSKATQPQPQIAVQLKK